MDLQEVGWGGMDWIALVKDTDRWWAVVNSVMKLWGGKFLDQLTTGQLLKNDSAPWSKYVSKFLDEQNSRTNNLSSHVTEILQA